MHSSNRRFGWRAAGVALAGLSLILTACSGSSTPAETSGGASDAPAAGGDWEALVAAAEAEGELVIYGSMDRSDVIFKEAFEKAYPGIKVTAQRTPTGELVTQTDQELEAGVGAADVVFHTQTPWFTERGEQGLLTGIQVSPDNEAAYGDYDGATSVPVMRYPFLLAYNTEKGAPITDLEDLAAKAKETGGTIGYLDPKASISLAAQYDAWDEAYPGLFDELAALPHAMYSSTQPGAQSLASGEIAYFVAMVPGTVTLLAEQGAPVQDVVPADDHKMGAEYAAAALATAPHPNAAQLFLNWIMTEEAQKLFVDEWPSVAGYIVPGEDFDFDSVSVYDPADWPKERQDEFHADWDSLFR